MDVSASPFVDLPPETAVHIFDDVLDHNSFPPNRPILTVDICLSPIPAECRNEVCIRQLLRALCSDCVVLLVKDLKKNDAVGASINVHARHTIIGFSKSLVCTPFGCCWGTSAQGARGLTAWAVAQRLPIVSIEEMTFPLKDAKQNRKRDALTKDLICQPTRSRTIVCPQCAPQRQLPYELVCLRNPRQKHCCFTCGVTLLELDLALWCCGCDMHVCLRCLHESSKFAYNRSVLTTLNAFTGKDHNRSGRIPAFSDTNSMGSSTT